MKVIELIQVLQTMPPGVEVKVAHDAFDSPLFSVKLEFGEVILN